jgi:FkbM family methyltransferase
MQRVPAPKSLYKRIIRPPFQWIGVEQVGISTLLYYKQLSGELKRRTLKFEELSAEFFISSNLSPIRNRISDEEQVFEDLKNNLDKSDVFYDIGAQYGVYSCLIGNHIEGQIVSFEPLPMAYGRLRLNLRYNNVNSTTFRTGLTSASNNPSRWLEKQGQVPLATGDSIISTNNLPVPTLIKVDVEGGELDVLRGLKNTLSEPDCRLIYCEVHPQGCFDDPDLPRAGLSNTEINDLKSLLIESGFCVDRFNERSGQFFFRGEK